MMGAVAPPRCNAHDREPGVYERRIEQRGGGPAFTNRPHPYSSPLLDLQADNRTGSAEQRPTTHCVHATHSHTHQ